MAQDIPVIPTRRALIRRFWSSARDFWLGDSRRIAWILTIGLVVLVFVQLAVQYWLNVWNRNFFDAVEKKDGAGILRQAIVFLPLAAAAIGLSVLAVYGRMTTQRTWRVSATNALVDRWLRNGHYYQLNLVSGDHQIPESRITDDLRNATDAPVDFAVDMLWAIISAVTFIGVLWVVGGGIEVPLPEGAMTVPGYLVIAAIGYAAVTSVAIVLIARRFIPVSEAVNQSEADYRYALSRVRENGESIALLGGEEEERAGLRRYLAVIVERWRAFLGQHMRSTVVSYGNNLLAPVVPLVLCAPKYLDGTMSLGEMTQAAAAFVQVQSAFAWLVDHYPRLSDWMASVRRSASLMVSIDHLESVGKPGEVEAIKRILYDGEALRLTDLSVTLDDGTVVINDANVEIGPRDKVLIVGESGTGKSTLVRAIAGLWPWGQGEIAIPRAAKLFLMPQRPYIPLGSLRRVATYPLAASEVPDATLRQLMDLVGVEHLADRLELVAPWDHVLSGGEKQRIAFVRLLLHQPDIVVMDEATSALDPASQTRLMKLVAERLPDIALVSIAHRPELEVFHDRKLIFEHLPDGSRVIDTDLLEPADSMPLHYSLWLRRLRAARP